MNELRKIKRALVSVSDKTGIAEFAKVLDELGIEIISTGGTARTLRDAGLNVREVSEITEFPEMMDGRIKTLHPKIHGAFLALRDNEEHVSAMKKHNIEPIDLVVVNLYPFEQTIDDEEVRLEEAIEQIDIGGPAMIRSASKNWRDVLVVTDTRLYEKVIEELKENGGTVSLSTRQTFAALAFTHTAHYDAIISDYLIEQLSDAEFDFVENFHPAADDAAFQMFKETEQLFGEGFGDEFNIETFDENGNALTDTDQGFAYDEDIALTKVSDLRYGENPHQKAALYEFLDQQENGIANAEQLRGKEMSFNNYLDADAAWRLICDFDELACAIIKHTNPSGVGIGKNNEEAYRRALATDPVSAFGGIVAFNEKVDAEVAASVNEIFTEVVLAPDFDAEALDIFRKKKNLRVLRVEKSIDSQLPEYRTISGGMLVQKRDDLIVTADNLRFVTKKQPTEEEIRALLFAWKICKHVKSNAIVFANEFQTVGVGAGQMNRVDSVRIAAMRAEKTQLELNNTVLASDAFFPFRDNIDEAAEFGISAIIQPGGSMRDEEVIQAADEHGLAMALTGVRHFKH
ncbi:MAG: bifunctional phosphoribosylaminoimidazolecarboxamide formyltransferase/IMP cyclohydrolase [Acidobacteriota bacterium]|jgi:phosphoribosylaminoimidazolecarboxamide formyltransferase/IMP cyclohydrolase|nr:bifunctional phosphoribosylaminoimidazolecarboxamide formyltransferase/IMP cyclohydrolase [Acidobacteriota bacterium]